MNNKFVLKALEMDDREWERHLEFISVLRGLSDSDREQLVESLTPQAKPKPRKKTECAKCDYRQSHNIHRNTALTGYHEFVKVSKSARASSLQQQIANRGIGDSAVALDGNRYIVEKCAYDLGSGKCGALANDPVHDGSFGYGGYHEFQPPQQAATGD